MESIYRLAATIQADAQSAVEILTRTIQTGHINPDEVFAKEMVILYVVITGITCLIVSRSVRSLVYKAVDTLFAIVLLGLISMIVLGIPFVIFYLSFRGIMHVLTSILSSIRGP
mmetsp:Transcript_13634/g.27227  ORF Transcript_13634/g.27227 Transcript_13634/m.27227 type:complete len:114 (+) Transcript_13634:1532-1873(+)